MSNDKYVSVSDLENLDHRTVHHDDVVIHWYGIQKLINKAEPMISVEDVKRVSDGIKTGLSLISTLNRVKAELQELTNPQPEKYAGLTADEWQLLAKQPYIKIQLRSDMGARTKYFLDEALKIGFEYSEILSLESDPENMTRTDLDLPDGIGILLTLTDRSVSDIWTTPIGNKEELEIKHYRILGVSDEQ